MPLSVPDTMATQESNTMSSTAGKKAFRSNTSSFGSLVKAAKIQS